MLRKQLSDCAPDDEDHAQPRSAMRRLWELMVLNLTPALALGLQFYGPAKQYFAVAHISGGIS